MVLVSALQRPELPAGLSSVTIVTMLFSRGLSAPSTGRLHYIRELHCFALANELTAGHYGIISVPRNPVTIVILIPIRGSRGL
jgi:hypothetical protein